jgi:hypothetical protein
VIIIKEAAVTFIDILGWKGIWQRKENAVENLIGMTIFVEDVLTKTAKEHARFAQLESSLHTISDTIIIITFGDFNLSIELHSDLMAALIKDSILKGIPIRGAIGYGEVNRLGNVLVGPVVDEVASWYEKSDVIGVFLTPSAHLRTMKTDLSVSSLINYDIPVKQYGKLSTLCVNWVYDWVKFYESQDINKLIDCFLRMGPITPEIGPKFYNTINFYKHSLSKLEEEGNFT